ncbi:MAG: hypothetical protein U0559_09255 [Anaerolineae bacterium]
MRATIGVKEDCVEWFGGAFVNAGVEKETLNRQRESARIEKELDDARKPGRIEKAAGGGAKPGSAVLLRQRAMV